MILCVGTSSSGKSVLLRHLMANEEFTTAVAAAKGGATNVAAVSAAGIAAFGRKNMVASIPTVGTNLVTLTRGKKSAGKESSPEVVVIREVGGSMAPLWHSYVEPAKTRGVLYTVDASSPETVGAATIYLVDLLSQPGLDLAQVMVVFTKTDLPSARSLPEIRALMRMDQICSNSKQIVRHTTFNAEAVARSRGHGCPDDEVSPGDRAARERLDELHQWCLRFAGPKDKA